MKRDEVLAAIARERARLFAAVDAFGDGATTRAVTGEGWTAKDVLAHCIHWAGQIAFGIGAQLDPPAYLRAVEGRPSEEEWNARAVEHYRLLNLEEVKAELERVVALLEERIRMSDDAGMLRTDRIPWAERTRPLWEQIGGETFLHWPRHAEDLERLAGVTVTQA